MLCRPQADVGAVSVLCRCSVGPRPTSAADNSVTLVIIVRTHNLVVNSLNGVYYRIGLGIH